MKLFYAAIVLLIISIWLGLFDPQPIGERQQQTTIPADTPFTVKAVAEQLTIAADMPLTVAIDPTGYVAIWQVQAGERVWLRRWQTWPHVRSAQNEIWIDWQDGAMTVRINQELLWDAVAVSLVCPCEISADSELFMSP